jgi:hypothetical protein
MNETGQRRGERSDDTALARFDRTELEGSIIERFETVAGRFPERASAHGRTWTYDAFNRAANRVAHAILA